MSDILETDMPIALSAAVVADCESAFPSGFDSATIEKIVVTLFGIFKNCLAPATPAVARGYATDTYFNLQYDPAIMRLVAVLAKRAAIKAGTRIDNLEAAAVAFAILERIRLADDAALMAVLAVD